MSPVRGAGDPSPRSTARVFLGLLALKAYGLGVLYLLFLFTATGDRLQGSFLFVEAGETRSSRIREIERGFWHRLGPFDGQWYLDIAAKGYRRLGPGESSEVEGLPPGNYAFFPLLPTLVRGIRACAPDGDTASTTILLVIVSAAKLTVVWRLARGTGQHAGLSVALLLAFPTAAFQYGLYTEGLFLCLSSVGLLFALRTARAHCALVGFLCGLCRPQGILIAVPFAYELLWRDLRRWRESRRRVLLSAIATVCPLSGFACMAWVSYRVAGSPLGFVSIQSAWGRTSDRANVLRAFEDVLSYTGPPVDLLAVVLGVGLLPFLWRRMPRSLALYGTGAVLMPLATGSILSFGRFLSVSIPHFLCLASLLHGWPRTAGAVLLLFVGLQVLLAKGLVGWYFVG